MSTIKINYPVNTLDNHCLLTEGCSLDTDTLDTLIQSARKIRDPASNLSGYGSVVIDTLTFLKEPPYDKIFTPAQMKTVLETMERVSILLSVLRYLDYFQKSDFYTYRHLIIVYALAILLADDLMEDKDARYLLAETGPSHDFGKSCTPLPVLQKETPLTRNERAMLEHHAAAGYVLLGYYLKDADCLSAELARDHHERKDGSGYPTGAHLEDLHTEIIIVSDIYDALISTRPYRAVSYDNRTALEEITEMAQRGVINWSVLKALIACNRDSRPHYTDVQVSMEKRGTPPPKNVYGITEE